eukprot:scaffold200659_cov33-Tisochrysis_lutea.AAC.3
MFEARARASGARSGELTDNYGPGSVLCAACAWVKRHHNSLASRVALKSRPVPCRKLTTTGTSACRR